MGFIQTMNGRVNLRLGLWAQAGGVRVRLNLRVRVGLVLGQGLRIGLGL